MRVTVVSVVIVNWNSGGLLRSCVASIPRALEFCGGAGEIIVLDNASVDESAQALVCGDVPVCLVRNSDNRGFGAACNQGATFARGEYLLFLNPDAVLESESISGALGAISGGKFGRVGVCGIKLVDEQGEVARGCARKPTPVDFVAASFGVDKLFPRLAYVMRSWDHGESRVVDHVIGAFYLVRRDVFLAFGGFDERFFVYLEDLDFSVRIKAAGYSNLYFAGARAFHKGGGTSETIKAARLFYSLRSRIQYAFKHFSAGEAWAVLSLTVLVEPWTRLVHCALRGAWSDAGHTLNGYGMLLKSLPDVLRKARSTH